MSSCNTASLADGGLDRSAQAAGELARALAVRTEQERRLPHELISSLQASGLLRAGAPAALGAAQAPPAVT
jgi:indole-3-acetate monooxygenase